MSGYSQTTEKRWESLYTISFNSSGTNGFTGRDIYYWEVLQEHAFNKIKKIYNKKHPRVGLKGSCLLHDNAPASKKSDGNRLSEQTKC